MRNTLLAGLALAVAAALTVVLGELLGLELGHVALIGTGLGAVVALVPDRSPAFRLAGFAAGFVLAWIGYALRAGVLPDSAGGRAVAVFLVVLACVAVCAASLNRVPIWSSLVGVAAMVGSYEEIYTNAPSQFLRESPGAATTVLLAAALGFLAASILPAQAPADGGRRVASRTENPNTSTTMTDLLKPEGAK